MLLKRWIAMLLVLCMTVGFIPAQAFAAEDAPDVQVDNSDLTLESTNSFGALLSQELEQEGNGTTSFVSTDLAEGYDTGYSVTDVTVEGKAAAVTYESLEDAILVVGLYSEDGLQLLNTAKTEVSKDATLATVIFEGDMPDFFIVNAYLLDVYDYSPLCPAYETPLYTQDMQELLAMTAEDCIEEYGEDRVYNLDNSNHTNFAVYAEGTILLQETAGINTVVSADNDNLLYVFENANEQITGLTQGDVVVYELTDEDLLIFKVDSLSVDGTTVTVTGADLEIEEVFALMKLENTANGSNATLDTSDMDENLTYNGTSQGGSTYNSRIDSKNTGASTNAWEGSESVGIAFGYTLAEKSIGEADPDKLFTGEGKVSANFEFGLNISLNFYISLKRQFVEVKITSGFQFGVTFEGTVAINGLKLGQFDVMICTGVYAHLKPRLKVSFTGKATLSVSFQTTIGGSVEHRAGGHWTTKNLSTSPTTNFDLEFEGVLFFGVDLYPSLTIISKAVAEASLEALAGVEIKGTLHYGTGEKPDTTGTQYHACKHCLDGEISAVMRLVLKLKFLDSKKLTHTTTLKDATWKLKDFYWSFDNSDFGWGECPYYKYRLTLRALNKDMSPAAGIEIKYSDGTSLGKTNTNGVLDGTFLDKGSYTFTATIEKQPVSTSVYVYTYTSAVLTASQEYWDRQEKLKLLRILPDNVSASSAYKQGTCGDDAKWVLYASGVLEVTGKGAMDSYSSVSDQPWYQWRDKIKSVRIGDRITTVGNRAFEGCTNIRKLIIEDNVTTIRDSAFYGCSGIKELLMPIDLDFSTYYSYSASFGGCTNIEKIHYTKGQTGNMNERKNSYSAYSSYDPAYSPERFSCTALKSVYVNEGVTAIGNNAFYNATALTQVALPFTVDTIGSSAFYGCYALPEIELPATLTTLGYSSFSDCTALTKITLPGALTSIPASCFSGCTGLTELTIPDNITKLDTLAFYGCSGITSLTMPVDLDFSTYTANSASFGGCSNIKTIRYTYGQTGDMNQRKNTYYPNYGYDSNYSPAYYSKEVLESASFDDGITVIGNGAFTFATALTSVDIPDSVISIGSSAFSGCSALPEIELPATLTTLGYSSFSNCTALTKITLPGTLTSIPSSCFSGCTGLTELTIPDNITKLDTLAFYGCSGITSLTMPVDLDFSTYTVNSASFGGCSNIKTIRYTYGQTGDMNQRKNTYYTSTGYDSNYSPEYYSKEVLESASFDEGITVIGNSAFTNATALTSVDIPDSVITIGSNAFYGCYALPEIELPATLTTLGYSSFSYCTALTKITLPGALTSIPASCFSGCTGLTELTIPDNITSLENYAFYGCSNITTLTMPVDLDFSTYSTNSASFNGCSNIKTIRYTYGQTGDMNQRKNTYYASTGYDSNYSPEYYSKEVLESASFDDGITVIGNNAFTYATALTSVDIPDSVITIGSNAFYGCYALPEIELPATLTTLGYSSFSNCTALTKITLPGALASIPSSCFSGCTGLTELTIPDNITKLDTLAFYGCSGITSLTMPVDLDFSTYSTNSASFGGCSNIKTIHYTYGQTGDMNQRKNTYYASTGYDSNYSPEYYSKSILESACFDSDIVAISNSAFYNATKLRTVRFDGNAPSFGYNCFYSVTATVLYPHGDESWTENVFQNYGGNITWTPYILLEDGSISTEIPEPTEPTEPEATEPTEPEATEPAASEATEPAEPETVETEIPEAAVSGIVTVEIPGAAASGFRMGVSAGSQTRAASTGAPTQNLPSIGDNKLDAKPDTGAEPDAVYPGFNESEEAGEALMLQHTTFSGLVAGQEYMMLALLDLEAEDLLAPQNILYIRQAPAAADGTLTFSYILKENVDNFYVFATGAAHRDLKDAVITFPEVYSNQEAMYISPTVTYNSETLIEGVDYVIVEGAVATEAGTYSCTLRGICNYTGLVTCSYTMGEPISATFTGTTVALEDSLALYFALDTQKLGYTNNYVVITRTDAYGATESHTVPQAKWLPLDENTVLIPFPHIAAKEMTDTFTAVVYGAGGEAISSPWTDSIQSYAMRMLSKEEVANNTELRTLYVDMLNYGAAAQNQFRYATDDLANAQLTETQQSYATTDYATKSQLSCSPGRAGTALTLRSRITLDFFFKNSAIGADTNAIYAVISYTDHYGNAKEFRVEGSDFRAYTGSITYVSAPGLVVADYAQAVTCTVYDTSGNILAWATDSIEGYAHRMATSLPEIVDAIMKFCSSSYRYFH